MSISKRDTKVYNLARQYLLDFKVGNNTPINDAVLDSRLNYAETIKRPKKIEDLYLRLLFAAQNANRKPKVIGGAIGGVENLRDVLLQFQPQAIVDKYDNDSQQVLRDVVKEFKNLRAVNKEPKELWLKYCVTILSIAEFLSQFASANEFFKVGRYV